MLRKKIAVLLLSAAMAMTMLSGCGDNTAKEDKKAAAYAAAFCAPEDKSGADTFVWP